MNANLTFTTPFFVVVLCCFVSYMCACTVHNPSIFIAVGHGVHNRSEAGGEQSNRINTRLMQKPSRGFTLFPPKPATRRPLFTVREGTRGREREPCKDCAAFIPFQTGHDARVHHVRVFWCIMRMVILVLAGRASQPLTHRAWLAHTATLSTTNPAKGKRCSFSFSFALG